MSSRDYSRVEIGPVETTHPELGSAKHAAAPPPAPSKVRQLLPQLADLPKAAYPYIQEVLGKLGWDTRNPRSGGQVYTQGEFRKHDRLLEDACSCHTADDG